ncbi:glycine cleavage system aminomethyltransferase GcvT [Gracilinema caldarium]|uniref:aminomethyltransferase n=1 Tax=Gracilinema caldarium (strain ATCC 51460 / DSM 7334 / H1) TaxID=744872 RepID=F8F3U8_GRAC1|nr:glycine cleavage system aminomethyltransferase GcvT [Gracilinema caldarium]AEJ20467.1 glycine cleavage system T protein [Gracilinema caldarium DSM 7334]
MKTTLLHSWHETAGARFAPFAGFDMPIQYPTGAIEEHRLTRRSVGLFDIDHMGQVLIWGPGAGEALSRLVSNRLLDMKPGEARYALLLNETGGVIDDLFIYRLAASQSMPDRWFIVVNAGNREIDVAYFQNNLKPPIQVQDISDETYMIAVQGPQAVPLIDSITGGALSATSRFTMIEAYIDGILCRIGRTGYTGEDGAELFYPAEKSVHIWEFLLAAAQKLGIEAGPIGLAARDSLRFEAGMPLHGHEITPSITPLEALLSWACDFEKDFVGKSALIELKARGLSRKLVTINVTGGVPREGYQVLDREGKEIGICVAGMYCPTTETYSANAFVPPAYAKVGTQLAVSIRGNAKPAVVVQRPLYVPTYRRTT